MTNRVQIPVIEIARETFGFLWRQRRDLTFLSLTCATIFVFRNILLLSEWSLIVEFEEFHPFKHYLSFAALSLFVWLIYSVTWHRKYLVPDEVVTFRNLFIPRNRHRYFLLSIIRIALLVIPIYFLLVILSSFLSIHSLVSSDTLAGIFGWPASGIDADGLSLPMDSVPTVSTFEIQMMGLSLLVLLPTMSLLARYALLLPAAAIDNYMKIGVSWERTRRNGWRLALLLILFWSPFWVVEVFVSIFSDLYGTTFFIFATFLEDVLWLGGVAAGVTALSISYKMLTESQENDPAASTI